MDTETSAPKRKRGRPRKAGPREPSGRVARPKKAPPSPLLAPISPGEGPSGALKLLVEQMVAVGDPAEVIARAVGVSEADLAALYASEVANGLARRRCEVVDLMFRKAREGHTDTIKRLFELTGARGAEKAFLEADEAGEAARERRRYVGKKELAAEAAQTAGEGTEWGDDLAPAETLQ